MKQINWGMLGFGQAGENFYNLFKSNKKSKLRSVASISKLDYLKKKNFRKSLIYNNYIDLLSSSDLDIIYISLVNSEHEKYIKECTVHSKDILVEKPSCLDRNEFEKISKIIKQKNLYFRESILYLSHPIINKIVNILKYNEIGEINQINAEYGFNFAKKKLFFFGRKKKLRQNIFNENLGGGAINNFGHYPLSAFYLFSNLKSFKNIDEIKVNGKIGKTSVDEFAQINIKLNDCVNLNARVSIKQNLKNKVEIIGNKGSIIIPDIWTPPRNFKIYLKNEKQNKEFFFNEDRSLWEFEIENIENEIINNKSYKTESNIQSSLIYLKISEEWKKRLNI